MINLREKNIILDDIGGTTKSVDESLKSDTENNPMASCSHCVYWLDISIYSF